MCLRNELSNFFEPIWRSSATIFVSPNSHEPS